MRPPDAWLAAWISGSDIPNSTLASLGKYVALGWMPHAEAAFQDKAGAGSRVTCGRRSRRRAPPNSRMVVDACCSKETGRSGDKKSVHCQAKLVASRQRVGEKQKNE